MAVAEFNHDFPGGVQECFGLRCNQTIKLQTVRAAVERGAWIKIAHFRLERRNLGGRNVGRIADDEVGSRGVWQCRKTIALQELNPFRDIVTHSVFFGQSQSVR